MSMKFELLFEGNSPFIPAKFAKAYGRDMDIQGFGKERQILTDPDSDDKLYVYAWEYVLKHFTFPDENMGEPIWYLVQDDTGLYAACGYDDHF